jgi:hypothetical protein
MSRLRRLSAKLLYEIKSEQVSLARQLMRSAIIFALTFLGSLLIHRLWFAGSAWALWDKLLEGLVATGGFFATSRRFSELLAQHRHCTHNPDWECKNLLSKRMLIHG